MHSKKLSLEKHLVKSIGEKNFFYIISVITGKAFSPIETFFDFSSIFSKDVHPWSAFSPIDFTKFGIVICFNDKHSPNTFFPIEDIYNGSDIFDNEIHL